MQLSYSIMKSWSPGYKISCLWSSFQLSKQDMWQNLLRALSSTIRENGNLSNPCRGKLWLTRCRNLDFRCLYILLHYLLRLRNFVIRDRPKYPSQILRCIIFNRCINDPFLCVEWTKQLLLEANGPKPFAIRAFWGVWTRKFDPS